MPAVETYLPELQSRLDELLSTHGVPGAVCAVAVGDDSVVAASGLANVSTGIEVTADTIFQIGSVSKLYTTTLVAQLVDAGLIELDEPVRAVLNEFRVADDTATLAITPRHLLSHTSGIEGDHFYDCGRNPDALWRYVSTLDEIGQVHPPDDLYSYCNSGFAVAGRLVEEVTGDHFTRALRKRLIKPLGLQRTVTLVEHAINHRVAAGHRQRAGTEATIQPWTLGRFNAPMGGVMSTAPEVVEFGRVYLRRGKTADGKQVLPSRSVDDLLTPNVEQYDGTERGLGWHLLQWGGTQVVGHDGDTVGQTAYLRVIPDHDAVIVLLVNSIIGAVISRPLLEKVAADLFDLEVPGPPVADPDVEVDGTRYTGIYERMHQRLAVAGEGDSLQMTIIPDEFFRYAGFQEQTLTLRPVGDDRFVTTVPETGLDVLVAFGNGDADDDERPHYLHHGGRAHRRIS